MVQFLLAKGEDVVVLDHLGNGRRENVLAEPFFAGHVGDRDLLDRIFKQFSVSAVLHFAGSIQVEESVNFPAKYLDNNVRQTNVLLDAMVAHQIPHLIFSSTAAVYGASEGGITEQHSKAPISPYGVTKLLAEQLIEGYGRLFGVNAIAFRYFNAAGADPSGRLGECHEPETHLIPLVLQAASGRRAAIKVFGKDYETRDGTCVRDYVHVVDLCEAHYLGLQALRSGRKVAPAYNLGSSQGFTVREVIEASRRLTQCDFAVVEEPRRSGDTPILIADSRLAREELNWQPRYSDLETIIAHAWQWEQKLCGAR